MSDQSGRTTSSSEEAAMSGERQDEVCDFIPGPAELEDEPDRHLPCVGCDCCEAESCEALLCMDCPCHAPVQGRGQSEVERQAGHFDGECARCGCTREWRTWGDCACGICREPCTPLTAPARVVTPDA